ncbi:hypothetical protein PsYK624_166250 [Phanerochaete sordida]|uniref:Uncharacterized protein n=1 Tax=Phanerochaete sordida TaxID=48140 RepID=A0A9P3GX09_9APHY|nr:hypothetical protein PsYK624_166250 [Phanerochaete sordida]
MSSQNNARFLCQRSSSPTRVIQSRAARRMRERARIPSLSTRTASSPYRQLQLVTRLAMTRRTRSKTMHTLTEDTLTEDTLTTDKHADDLGVDLCPVGAVYGSCTVDDGSLKIHIFCLVGAKDASIYTAWKIRSRSPWLPALRRAAGRSHESACGGRYRGNGGRVYARGDQGEGRNLGHGRDSTLKPSMQGDVDHRDNWWSTGCGRKGNKGSNRLRSTDPRQMSSYGLVLA